MRAGRPVELRSHADLFEVRVGRTSNLADGPGPGFGPERKPGGGDRIRVSVAFFASPYARPMIVLSPRALSLILLFLSTGIFCHNCLCTPPAPIFNHNLKRG